ncbi:uncharacterized protein LOC129617051 [Condylostylus longicornis]|uniref:uncharacterized protein LOC129617051 n=1 Tax=Condylostylus longicornis TaxID=2530218 RepID=UPI00244DAD73|nr:uncharacterized protein LOC129617051 [Condylostylus longicornis]
MFSAVMIFVLFRVVSSNEEQGLDFIRTRNHSSDVEPSKSLRSKKFLSSRVIAPHNNVILSDIGPPRLISGQNVTISDTGPLCRAYVPFWDRVPLSNIVAEKILAGLSNQLFRVSVSEDFPTRSKLRYPDVLLRVYGAGAFYKREAEVKIFNELGRRQISPKLIAEFEVLKVSWRY